MFGKFQPLFIRERSESIHAGFVFAFVIPRHPSYGQKGRTMGLQQQPLESVDCFNVATHFDAR